MNRYCLCVWWLLVAGSVAAAGGPPVPEVYVWQRTWAPPLREAITQHAAAFSNVVVLAAEISWKPGPPQVVRVPVDYALLRATQRPVGLALRVGAYAGPFSPTNAAGRLLASVADSVVADAKAHGLSPGELQIDFDCAAAKLDGYRVWVERLRRDVAPVPLTITVLPSWLKQPGFRPLVAATDGYVLQVHSVERPANFDAPFTLCDPVAAQAAVDRAATFGVPFRVALPTYGYLMAFAPDGRFVGLSAEGPARNWPANARLRQVGADPQALALLVQRWQARPPAGMRGILWFRLPTAADELNWRWPTLDAMVAARLPQERLRCEPRRVEAGLVEISLVNEGELDISSRLAVNAQWTDARLVAGDGLRGFELAEGGSSAVNFQTRTPPPRLRPGDRWVIGWLRLSQDVEVHVELKKL